MPLWIPPVLEDPTIVLGAGELASSAGRFVYGDATTPGGRGLAFLGDTLTGAINRAANPAASVIALQVSDGGTLFVSAACPTASQSYTLPSATGNAGLAYRFLMDGGITLTVTPAAGQVITCPGVQTLPAPAATFPANKEFFEVFCDGFVWHVVNASPRTWAALGSPLGTAPQRGASGYVEANTLSPQKVIVTADAMTFVDANGAGVTLYAWSGECNYALQGPAVGGRDDNTAVTAYETGYFYGAYNPTTGASCLVRSASGARPQLTGALAGYTMYTNRLFRVRTDNTGNPFNESGYDRQQNFYVYQGGPLPVIASGTGGNPYAPTWASATCYPWVPPEAHSIDIIYGFDGSSGGSFIIAPDSAYGGDAATINRPIKGSFIYSGTQATQAWKTRVELNDNFPGQIFWASTIADFFIEIVGYRLD